MKKFWKENSKVIKYVLLVFSVWQIIIGCINLLAPYVPIPNLGNYNYIEKKNVNPSFFWNRANFDGIHYLDIAKKDYGVYQQAFFPFYPQAIRFFTPFFGGRDLLSGLFISWFSCLTSFFLLYKLISFDYDQSVAKRSLLFLVFFPTSFYFSMVYSESLFLLLVLGSFYAARKKKWLLAGLVGAIASYTRLVGIFLFPALLYELWSENKIRAKYKIQNLFPLLLVPLGLLSYMKFLGERYNDSLMFLHVQPFFGAGRSGGKIILLYQVFWRYLKMVLTTKLDFLYFTVWLEFLVAVFFLLLIYLAYKKKIRLSYLIFSFLAFITPTLSGTFSSLPRYALVLFPCFICLGLIKSQKIQKYLYTIFGFLFIISLMLFFKGYWVS